MIHNYNFSMHWYRRWTLLTVQGKWVNRIHCECIVIHKNIKGTLQLFQEIRDSGWDTLYVLQYLATTGCIKKAV